MPATGSVEQAEPRSHTDHESPALPSWGHAGRLHHTHSVGSAPVWRMVPQAP